MLVIRTFAYTNWGKNNNNKRIKLFLLWICFTRKGWLYHVFSGEESEPKVLAEDHYLLVVPKEHVYPANVSLLDMLIFVDPVPWYPFYQKHLIHCSGFHLEARATSFCRLVTCPRLCKLAMMGVWNEPSSSKNNPSPRAPSLSFPAWVGAVVTLIAPENLPANLVLKFSVQRKLLKKGTDRAILAGGLKFQLENDTGKCVSTGKWHFP